MDVLGMLSVGLVLEYEGRRYITVGSAYPMGTLVVEEGNQYPANVVLIRPGCKAPQGV